MRQRNGTAPVSRSPEAVHQGTTWDHRAADLCMNHVLTLPRQTEPTVTEETFGREGILFFRDAGGTETTGMGGGLHKEITYSDVVFVPATCLFEPSVMWNEEHGGSRRDDNPLEQSRCTNCQKPFAHY